MRKPTGSQSEPNQADFRQISRREFLSEAAGVTALSVFPLPTASSGIHAGGESERPADLESLQHGFEHPPEGSKIMVRWWWFGPSVTQAELEREMQAMKDAGIGGFEVQTVYPLMLDDPDRGFRNTPYLSDEYLEALRFVRSKAQELGLRMDLTLGSGWPYGGPSVPVTQAAGMLRFEAVAVEPGVDWVPVPSITTGEKLIAAFLAKGDPGNFAAATARQILSVQNDQVQLPRDRRGPHVLLFFVSSRTGQQVKRAAVGAEGFVVDHYDHTAIEHYLTSVGDRLMQAFGSHPPRAVFCDSLEVYGSDWTDEFPEEFQKRRGYDLTPFLPALVGGIGAKTGAIRHDWGRTLSELFNEHFVAQVERWARQHGTLFRAQLYGTPPALLSSYSTVDLVEGEGAHWNGFAPARWASSASHLYGRTVTSSEVWTWLHSPAFRATPLDLKAEADLHFLEGVNQLVGHGWPYSPPEAGEPGWRFYAAAALNTHNPWWIVMPEITLYLERLSFILRQGNPVNEVAVYLPTSDAWAGFSPGHVSVSEAIETLLGPHLIPRLLEAGYGFDFIDDTVIEQLAKAGNGTLEMNRNRYPIVILPGVERMPLGTLSKLADFARQGGILVATRRTPSLAPGLAEQERETSQIREIWRQLFEGSLAHVVRDENQELAKVLSSVYPPAVSFWPPAPEVGFVHRRSAFAGIYFLANTGNQRSRTQATFKAGPEATEPEWWDPFTGKVQAAAVLARSNGAATVTLDLEPYGSRILVISNRRLPARAGAAAGSPAHVDLSAGWKVTFGDTGRSTQMDHLRSWTEEEQTRFFSGHAIYERTVTIAEHLVRPGREVFLDFGEGTPLAEAPQPNPGMRAWLESPVREAAVAYLNGRQVGSVWRPPFLLDVTGFLQAGENTLRIVVGNSAINQMAGRALPDYRLLNRRYGERFTPQDMENLEPLPSGLLRPVRLVLR